MARQKPELPEDDGRTFAEMNVEGMPWYNPSKGERRTGEKLDLTPSQRRRMIWGVLSAVGVITLVFAVVYFLVILGMDLAWS